MDENIEEEFDEEASGAAGIEVDDLDEEELDDEFAAEGDDLVIDDAEVIDDPTAVATDDDADDDDATPGRKRPAAGEEDDPDDVEADLDTILKDRIASGDDLEDEEEEEVPDRNDPDATEGVAAKRDGEFTCGSCFMIVHPRQFGRRDRLTCPAGDEDCPSIAIVRKQLG